MPLSNTYSSIDSSSKRKDRPTLLPAKTLYHLGLTMVLYYQTSYEYKCIPNRFAQVPLCRTSTESKMSISGGLYAKLHCTLTKF